MPQPNARWSHYELDPNSGNPVLTHPPQQANLEVQAPFDGHAGGMEGQHEDPVLLLALIAACQEQDGTHTAVEGVPCHLSGFRQAAV